MKRTLIALVATVLCCLLLFAGCAENKEIAYITDMERYADMQRKADKIDVTFDNYSGAPFRFTITDEADLEEIMEILFSETLTYLGGETNDGNHTSITIYQGEKTYPVSVVVNGENKRYYAFSTARLQTKITALATALGAFESVK